MLYDYLRSQYQPNEPIFLSDVSFPGVSRDNLRPQFKTLCDAGKIVRYEDGVYYIPARTRLKGGASLSPDLVALRKYIVVRALQTGIIPVSRSPIRSAQAYRCLR